MPPREQFNAMLASKLNPPKEPAAQVQRAKLCEAMVRADARLVLLNAPAGSGKTTVMLQAQARFQAAGVPVAWLTLDSADNDASRFLLFLAAAFERIGNAEGQHPSIFVLANSPGELALELFGRIASQRGPFVLFLDDFETIHAEAVLELLREVIRHLPLSGRLVLGSRRLPELGLSRMRAQGQLLEIEAEALRFSLSETRELLRALLGQSLEEAWIVQLHGKTEGWAAALSLATLAMQRREAPGEVIAQFSGTSAAIADYLAEDVLARIDDDQRGFLLRTSILGTLNASLCDAVCVRSDSAAMLERLAQANLFLIPLDQERREYRFHRLFAQFLRAQLARRLADEVPGLHRAAGEWYLREHRAVRAIDHLLAAGELEHSLRTLDEHAGRLFTEGRFRLLVRWLDPLPEATLAGHPRLRAVRLWAIAFTRGPKETLALIETEAVAADLHPHMVANMLALGPHLQALMDQVEEAYVAGKQNLEWMEPGQVFTCGILTNLMAHLSFIMGHYDEARGYLEQARRVQSESGSHFDLIYSETVEGEIDLLQGRLRQAMSRFRLAAESQASVLPLWSISGNVMVGVPLADALYEIGEVEQAGRMLTAYLPLIKELRLPDQLISAHVILARIAASRGDAVDAFQLLAELEQQGYAAGLPRAVASAKMERARLAILRGDPAGAEVELQRASGMGYSHHMTRYSTLANDTDTLTIGRLRWMIHAGQAQAAVPLLRRELEEAMRSQRLRRALKLRILQALALHECGELRTALESLREVLLCGSSEGWLRLYADEGERAARLLAEFLGAREAADRRPQPTADYLARLQAACGMVPANEPGAGNAPEPLVEPLTPAELKVLNLLAEGHSNMVMAKRLFVSETTVRTHLRNINGKLNAHNRTQAVAIARRLGLVR